MKIRFVDFELGAFSLKFEFVSSMSFSPFLVFGEEMAARFAPNLHLFQLIHLMLPWVDQEYFPFSDSVIPMSKIEHTF